MTVRRLIRWGVVGLVLAGLGWGAVSWWRGPEVGVVRVARRDLVQTVVASGRVDTPARVGLGARILGAAARVSVDEGDAVQAGQVLIELEDREASAAVAEARAGVLEAAARLGQVRSAGAQIAAEEVRRAQLDLDSAREELQRRQRLLTAGVATSVALEDAQRAVAVAESRRETAAVGAAQTQRGGGDRRAAAAAVQRAEAALAAAEARLSLTQITSPVAGQVLRRLVEPGDVVTPGTVLLEIARSGPTRLVVEPDERSLALLRAGQSALASAEAFPEQRFDATVSFIAPSVDPERGTVEVRLDVAEPPVALRPDMTVSVDIEVARRTGVLVVAADALRDAFSDAPFVLAVEAGRVRRRSVRLGARGDDVVEILGGLREGAHIVVGPEALPEGGRVRPRPAGG